jgi:hypothetical protein
LLGIRVSCCVLCLPFLLDIFCTQYNSDANKKWFSLLRCEITANKHISEMRIKSDLPFLARASGKALYFCKFLKLLEF